MGKEEAGGDAVGGKGKGSESGSLRREETVQPNRVWPAASR